MAIEWGKLLAKYGPTIASGVGSLAAGKTAGRQATNTAAMTGDQVRLAAQGQEENAQQGRANLQINQKEAERAALNDAYKNAIRSALALNMQDSSVVGLPKGVPNISFSGGMRPSAIGAEGKAAASALNNSAMQSLLHPDKSMELAPQQHFTPTPMKEAGFLENAMGVVGAAGGVLQQQRAQQTEDSNQSLVQRLIAQLGRDRTASSVPQGGNDINFDGFTE